MEIGKQYPLPFSKAFVNNICIKRGIKALMKIMVKNMGMEKNQVVGNYIHPLNNELINGLPQVQRVRTQMAKLNHRLMALELENQQHNQRWQVTGKIF